MLCKIYKELSKLNNSITNSLIKESVKDLNIHLANENIQMVNKNIKRCFALHFIRKLKINTEVRYHYTPLRMEKSQTLTTSNAGDS